jgi:hypothetical protein
MSAVAVEHLEITNAEYRHGYVIRLRFNDGTEQEVDFGPFLARARNPDTTDFRDLQRFKSFRIEDGDLVWGDFQMVFPVIDLHRGSI